MTVKQVADALELEVLCGTESALEAEVKAGYCGDLLSWVMGRADAGAAWITIMSNPNVAAVASLQGLCCVILAEGVAPDEGLGKRIEGEDIPLLRASEPAFTLAGKLYGLLYA
ncbi:MAG: hypothetical protein LBR85_01815 [Oscillospiraceae bacterium]|nr:hypothetical protein [Oscillospiraceae bacterium]